MARTLADMTPEEAREHLAKFDAGEFMEWTGLVRALRTIAGMSEEVEYRIVPTDHNGGKYQTRKWTRMVTEWQPDE